MAFTTTFGFTPTSPAVTVNELTANPQFFGGAVALDGGNSAVFFHTTTFGGQIRGRLVGPDGAPRGEDVVISGGVAPTVDTQDAVVSATRLTNGNIVVAWADTSATKNVLFRILDANLNPVTGILAGETAGQGASRPDVAALAGGGFVIAFEKTFTATDHDIAFVLFDASGTAIGSTTGTALDASGALDELPSVAGLADGGFAVAFDRAAGGSTAGFVAVRNADGSVRQVPSQFDPFGTINTQMDVVATPNGGFLVNYRDNGWGSVDLTTARFTAAGTFQEFLHSGERPGPALEALPAGAVNADGFTAVVYEAASDVFASLISPTGALLAVDRPLFTTAALENHASVTWISPTRILVTYTAQDGAAGFDGNGTAVAGQRFDARRIITGDGADDIINAPFDSFGNLIEGGGGSNNIIGNNNNDTITSGPGVDIIYGLGGDDFIGGGAGNSQLVGGAGNDQIYGGTGNDYMVGDDGNDTIVGLGGQDSLYGGAGNDYLVAGDGPGAVVDGGAGANTLWGASGNDYIVGGEGIDLAVGGGGSDYLFGNAGNDTLYGGQGGDFIYSNAGNDFIWTDDVGLPQSRDFIYVGGGTGVDTVADFVAGPAANSDVIVVSPASGIGSFEQVQAAMTQVGVYTVITMSGGDQLYVYNVQPFQLTAENFLFF